MSPRYCKVHRRSNEGSTTFGTCSMSDSTVVHGRLGLFCHEVLDKFSIADDLDLLCLQELPEFSRSKEASFFVARIEQPGVGCAQVGVVVPGMADKLPGSFGQIRERLPQQGTEAGNLSLAIARGVSRAVLRSILRIIS